MLFAIYCCLRYPYKPTVSPDCICQLQNMCVILQINCCISNCSSFFKSVTLLIQILVPHSSNLFDAHVCVYFHSYGSYNVSEATGEAVRYKCYVLVALPTCQVLCSGCFYADSYDSLQFLFLFCFVLMHNCFNEYLHHIIGASLK